MKEIEIKELAEKEFSLYWEELWKQGMSQRAFLKMMEKSYRILYIQAFIDGYEKAEEEKGLIMTENILTLVKAGLSFIVAEKSLQSFLMFSQRKNRQKTK